MSVVVPDEPGRRRRAAFIDGGGAASRALSGPGRPLHGLEPVPIGDLARTNLEAFGLVVVPRSSDAEALTARRRQFERFLDGGGAVIAFGEQWTEWLPGARWEPESPADLAGPPRLAEHPLVDGFAADELWWHRGPERWCSHGHLLAPSGAEVLVANSAGQAWCCIDRATTSGTILVATNLDLDTHAFHGSATAERLLERVIAWGLATAGVARPGPARPGPIAGFFSGAWFQRQLFDVAGAGRFAVVPSAELEGLDLASHRALWVPRESDQATLAQAAGRLDRFVRDGGCLVSFEQLDRSWLPGATWERRDVVLGDAVATDHPLVAALGSRDHPWHAHGVLHVPSDAAVLLADRNGGALLATYRWGSGAVLAGTVDGDAHAGYGSPLATSFVQAAIAWVDETSARAAPGEPAALATA